MVSAATASGRTHTVKEEVSPDPLIYMRQCSKGFSDLTFWPKLLIPPTCTSSTRRWRRSRCVNAYTQLISAETISLKVYPLRTQRRDISGYTASVVRAYTAHRPQNAVLWRLYCVRIRLKHYFAVCSCGKNYKSCTATVVGT